MLALDTIRGCGELSDRVAFGRGQISNVNWLLIFGLERHCVIIETRCLPLPCFIPDIFLHLPSPSSLSFSLYNPRLIAQTVMYRASLKTLLLSEMSLQWYIRSKEPICVHANEAEWVHPSWWVCKHTLMHARRVHEPAIPAERAYRPRKYNILFFLYIRPVWSSPHCYLL